MSNLFGGEPYLAVHWRRGDQLATKCKAEWDTSVNCGSAQDLRRLVDKKLQGRAWHVYVATNERDSETLTQLTAFGYKLQSDIRVKFDSLEAFFADIFLVGCASEALMPGFKFSSRTSSVHQLIHAFRRHHAQRTEVCGESKRAVDQVSCGELLAESCNACSREDCSGDCLPNNETGQCQASVSCGEHRAFHCAACPRGHGEAWCHGDCRWVPYFSMCVSKR